MTTRLARIRRSEDPVDRTAHLGVLREMVAAVTETFAMQFDIELQADGLPGVPDPTGVACGSTLALTSPRADYQFGCVFSGPAAETLTRIALATGTGEEASVADMGEALNGIPDAAAAIWRTGREASVGEHYQLGMPLFMSGNGWIRYFPRGVDAMAQRLRGPRGMDLQVILIWRHGRDDGGN